jgi:hypothetical protein
MLEVSNRRVHNPVVRAPLKLSAILHGRTPAGRSVAWAVDRDGGIRCIDGQGECSAWPLPGSRRAAQIVVSRSCDVWVRTVDNVVCRLDRASRRWDERFRVARGETIAGAHDGGVWIVGPRGVRWRDDAPDAPSASHRIAPPAFRVSAVSHGHDGTLWALGSQRRFGGRDVWRYRADSSSWMPLPPPAAATSLAGSRDGTAWSVNAQGDLWRLHPDGAGSFRECRLVADCRNCQYSPSEHHLLDVQVDDDDGVWVVARASASSETGCRIGRIRDHAARAYDWLASGIDVISMAAGVTP